MSTFWEAIRQLDVLAEDTAENELTRSHAHKEGGLTCPFCGSKDTKYVNTEQEADPEKDGAGSVGTQYVERHNYQCDNCTCKFYTFTETIILRGTEIAQNGIGDNEETTIILEDSAGIYEDAYDWNYEDGISWEEYRETWDEDLSDEEIKKRSYKVKGLWYEGKAPWALSDVFDYTNDNSAQLFIDLHNKMHELGVYGVSDGNDYYRNNGYLRGLKKDLRSFISWADDNAWDPFYSDPTLWHWENENDEEKWEFTEVDR